MKNIRILFLTALLVSISNVAFAQNKDKSWTFTAGFNVVDIRVPTDFKGIFKDYLNGSIEDLNFSGVPIQITAEKYIDKGFSVQLSGSFNNITKGLHKIPNGYDHNFLMFDARLKYALTTLFKKEFKWYDPYVGIGPGYSSIGEYTSGNDFKIGAGGGLNVWFLDGFGVSLESYYHHNFKNTFNDDSPTGTDFFQHAIALTYRPFGTDSDGDKIKDKNDKCPNTFGLVEFNGCPPPDIDNDGVIDSKDKCVHLFGLAKHDGCPDSDGDDIIDTEDKCPDKAGPSSNNGCPLKDTDGDGILDKNDDCPNKYGNITNKGCPEIKEIKEIDNSETNPPVDNTITFPTITLHFDLDSYYLSNIQKINLKNAIYKIKISGANFLIEGYTDSGGSSLYNQILSDKRVETVKNFLLFKDIDASMLKVIGYGETKPKSDNTTAEGRSNNRIVTISIIK